MKISYIFKKIKNMRYKEYVNHAKIVADKMNKSTLSVLFDMAKCALLYGSGYMDYFEFEFYLLNGKERKREFYAMPKEQAYSILKSIATINNLERNLVLAEPTQKELEDEEAAADIENIPLSFEQFYINKNENLIKLHEKLFEKFKKVYDEVYEEVTPNYIAIRNGKGKNICEVHIYKSKILIITREPKNEEFLIGEKVPEKYLWSLNYRVYFDNENEIDKIIEILKDAYNQIK